MHGCENTREKRAYTMNKKLKPKAKTIQTRRREIFTREKNDILHIITCRTRIREYFEANPDAA